MSSPDSDNQVPRFIAGRNPVREQLEKDVSRAEKLYLQKGATGKLMGLHKLAREHGIPTQFVPGGKLNSLVPGVNHQGFCWLYPPWNMLTSMKCYQRLLQLWKM